MMDRSIKLKNRVIKQLSYSLREDLAHGFASTVSRIDKVCDSKFFSCINKNNIIHNPCKAHSWEWHKTFYSVTLIKVNLTGNTENLRLIRSNEPYSPYIRSRCCRKNAILTHQKPTLLFYHIILQYLIYQMFYHSILYIKIIFTTH